LSVTRPRRVPPSASHVDRRPWCRPADSFSDQGLSGLGAHVETILFFLLNGVGLLIQYGCIGLVTDVFGLSGRIWYTVANLVGIGIGTLFRFWSYRKWIWVRPEDQAKLGGGRHRKGRPYATSRPQDLERSELTR